jgi:hypothetical protein
MHAAMLCKEKGFQTFLKKIYPKEWRGTFGEPADRAAATMRKILEVDSRKEIATDPLALEMYDKISAHYQMWKRGQ